MNMKKELKQEIGHRMWQIRKSLGLTQEQLVSHFEIGRADYSRIEKGVVLPNALILHTLRTKFDVSLDWLISNTGNMFIRVKAEKEKTLTLDFGEYTDEVYDLLMNMKKLPLVKHAVLSFFLEYKIKYKDIIQKVLEKNEISENKIN